MANPIENAYKATRASEKKLAGGEITVTRGADSSSYFRATVASTLYQEYMGDGVAAAYTSRDYAIDVDDYKLAGAKQTPLAGDVITEVINGSTAKFEVLSLNGERAFSYMDRSRNVFRVHTKEVASDYTTV